MTLLEFIATRLMGPPASRSGGRGVWNCPFHDDTNPSFNTMPPKAGCKDRYKCWSCGAWGDEMDLLKQFYPDDDYGTRKDRFNRLREEYENSDYADEQYSDTSISHRGSGEPDDDDYDGPCDADYPNFLGYMFGIPPEEIIANHERIQAKKRAAKKAARVWSLIDPKDKEKLGYLDKVIRLCSNEGITLEDLFTSPHKDRNTSDDAESNE